METEPRSAGPEDPNLNRACDQCRTRKIRCDKTSPCSNCRTAMRACSSIGVTHKPREQRHRVLISHQYERKIDLIEERLGGIEAALRSIAANGNSTVSHRPRQPTSSAPGSVSASTVQADAPTSSVQGDDGDDESDSAFEGDLSLTAHTAFARDFLENAVQRTSLRDVTPNMQAALTSLRQIISLQNQASSTRELRFPSQQPLPPGGLTEMPMPPMNAVVSMLKHQKASPPSILAVACSFLDIDELVELSRKVYFCTDTISHASFIIVNGCLYYICMEQAFLSKDPAIKAEYEEYQRTCQVNLETALASLPLMLPAKTESIEALLVASLYSIDLSKPSLAWHFVSNAATLCLTLGYHRAPMQKAERKGSIDVRTLLFWHTYTLDKDLAMRIGRPSIFQDWDITLPRKVDSTMVEDPWGPILTMWIREAELHHRVYEQLYSPAALAKPETERVETAHRLEMEQRKVMSEASQVREQALFGLKALNASALIDVHLRGDELSFHSTLTLIYRAIPAPPGSPSRFTSDCIATARLAMQLHEECMQQIAEEGKHLKAVYVHWAILLTPFAPFFVLFCHVIETSSVEDLKRLSDFVESLRPACALSEPVQRLHRLFQVLYNVAIAYVEAKSQQAGAAAPVNQEFDMYLSALGIPPTDFLAQGAGLEGGVMGQTATQTDQLGSWFSGAQQMIGLLEEDLSQFGQGGWMA